MYKVLTSITIKNQQLMHITIATIGKMKASPEAKLVSDYITRLPWRVEMREAEAAKFKGRSDETRWLLEQTKGVEQLFILDERGKDMTSKALASLLGAQIDEGTKRIGFIIGGADGLAQDQLPEGSRKLCFGKLTWPHMLVRVMLAEQLYRAHSILTNHPYHRE